MLSKNIINNALCYIDLNKSSTSEMVSDILIENNIKISSQLATILLSGIVLDTNNFILKTTKNTFLVAYKLVEFGASTADVQYLLKQDIKAYKMRQKIIVDFMIIDKNIAVSVGNSKLFYRKEDLAKVADTLLQFNNIETSFAIGRINKDYVGVSGRSNNYMNVGLILEKIGGGGNLYEGAANLLEKNPKKVKEKLIKVLKGDE